jgi:hypothetical protein
MAKCIKKGKTIKRVSDNEAERLVGYGKGSRIPGEGWKYCPKSEYKKSKGE